MLERLHDGRGRVNPQTGICPSGLHSDIPCSCGTLLMAESSTRASISRIVMLAEALFEVIPLGHALFVLLQLYMLCFYFSRCYALSFVRTLSWHVCKIFNLLNLFLIWGQ